jgi:hypothetical protein
LRSATLALAITTTTHTEQDLVQAWREQRILELGYQPEIAEVCALAEVDWHRLEHLIRLGCPLDTAIAILA